MNEKEILEQQVEALEKLLQLRSAIIEELENKVNRLEADKVATAPYIGYPPYPSYPYVGTPQWYGGHQQPIFLGGGGSTTPYINTCPDGSPHQFPPSIGAAGSILGTLSCQACIKCGQYPNMVSSTVTTVCNIDNNATLTHAANAPAHTSGYIQPISPNSNNVYTLTSIAK